MDLKEYFTKHWPDKSTINNGIEKYRHTGLNLVENIGENERVLDVGCGTNPFKNILGDRVWGIDITDIGSDEQIDIEDYKTNEKFDVAFVLGSINFGTTKTIFRQIKSVVETLNENGRIYWRCNPGLNDHSNEHSKDINFFEWSMDWHYHYSDLFGYKVDEFDWDGKDGMSNRLYVKWIKKEH